MLGNQTSKTSFEKCFLFDKIAFAVDKKGKLWVLGGKLAVQDDAIFPRDLGSDFFEGPTRTKLTEILRANLGL